MNDSFTTTAELFERRIREKDTEFLRELEALPKYIPRQAFTRILARYELFKLILSVPGSVIECGVYAGGGVFSFASLAPFWSRSIMQGRL